MFNTPNTDSSLNAGFASTSGFSETGDTSLLLVPSASPTNPSPVGSSGRQLTFIDARVDDYQQLADNIIAGDVFLLDSARDGVEQITETLAQYDDITGLHLVSHGSDGLLQLGNSILNSGSIGQYEQSLKSWDDALASEADIMVYGCDVAAGDTGTHFVKELGRLTGADVAASTDLTGSANQQGDWDLEFATGSIETDLVFSGAIASSYEGVLATYNEVSTLRIMPLGDSITRTGNAGFDGYRRDLWKKLVANGYNKLDFVGGGDFTGPNNDYDVNHEGHGGWRADQIADNAVRYAQDHNPDVVLLHIGTNDANQGQSVQSTLDDIGRIIDRLRSVNPNVAVLLAKIIPSSSNRNATEASAVAALSGQIYKVAQSKNQSGSPVILVDQYSGFNPDADTYDGLHPNNSGQAKMADRWYSALAGLFSSGHQYNRPGSDNGGGSGGNNPTPGGNGNGLKAEYYNNIDFTNLALTRTDSTVNFNWGKGSPNSNIGSDTFSARWTGQVEPRYSENYTFYTTSDDGIRLWVNGQLVIDRFYDQAPTEHRGNITLTAGQKYDIRMEYYEKGGGAAAKLSWSSASQSKEIIPESQLFSSTTTNPPTGGGNGGTTNPPTGGGTSTGGGDGLTAQYFDNYDYTNLKVTRIDPNINFDWGAGSPDSRVGGNGFSARWTGLIEAQYSETYTFYTSIDDGVQLWVNGQLLVDHLVSPSRGEFSGSIDLVAGQKYDIRMEYFEDGGDALAQLSWSSASQAKQIVPQSYLFSSSSAVPTPPTSGGGGTTNPPTSGGNGGNPTPSGNGNGLKAEYYNNMDFTDLALTRTDSTVNFNWGKGSPNSNIGSDTFSARWTGQVEPRYSEIYTFHTTSDDGIRLWVNGQLIIDRFYDQAPTEHTGTIMLAAGQKYDIRMDYYEKGGGAAAKLGWSSASQRKEIIPESQLFSASSGTTTPPTGGGSGGTTNPPTGGGTNPSTGGNTPTASNGDGLTAQYFDNYDYTNLKVTRIDPNINFDWGAGSPDSRVGGNGFSARWTGLIEAQYSETYTFYTSIDDGVQLWVNGQLLVDHLVSPSRGEFSGSIDLVAGQKYDIRMEYFEDGGDALAQLSWSSASQAKQIVPQSQLFSSGTASAPSGASTAPPVSAPPTAPPASASSNTPRSTSGTTASNGNGLLAQYFDNYDYTNLKVTRTDANINFDWGAGSPDSRVGGNGFSARWTGLVEAQYSETYTFYTSIDDGVQLWVNGQLLVDHLVSPSRGEFSGSIDLVAGQKYDIRMEYFEDGGDALAQLSWSSASQAKQIVPQSQLFS